MLSKCTETTSHGCNFALCHQCKRQNSRVEACRIAPNVAPFQSPTRVSWILMMTCFVSPRNAHWLWILKVWHDNGRYWQHKTAQHLFGIFWRPGIGKADERTVNGSPSTPLQLQHKATHAEDHAQQIHVVGRWILGRTSRWRSLIPMDFIWSSRIIDVVYRSRHI